MKANHIRGVQAFRALFFLAVFSGATLYGQSGSLTAAPNPCEIFLMEDLCSSTLTWSSQGATSVQLWVQGQYGETLVASTGGGGPYVAEITWIQDYLSPYTFQLFDYSSGSRGGLLASVNVSGVRSLRCRPFASIYQRRLQTHAASRIWMPGALIGVGLGSGRVGLLGLGEWQAALGGQAAVMKNHP